MIDNVKIWLQSSLVVSVYFWKWISYTKSVFKKLKSANLHRSLMNLGAIRVQYMFCKTKIQWFKSKHKSNLNSILIVKYNIFPLFIKHMFEHQDLQMSYRHAVENKTSYHTCSVLNRRWSVSYTLLTREPRTTTFPL